MLLAQLATHRSEPDPMATAWGVEMGSPLNVTAGVSAELLARPAAA